MKLKIFYIILILLTFTIYSKQEKTQNFIKTLIAGTTSVVSLKISIEMLEHIYIHWQETYSDDLLDKYLIFQLLSASAALAYVSGKTFLASIEYIKSIGDTSESSLQKTLEYLEKGQEKVIYA